MTTNDDDLGALVLAHGKSMLAFSARIAARLTEAQDELRELQAEIDLSNQMLRRLAEASAEPAR